MLYKIFSISAKTIPIHDGKIKPYISAMPEYHKGIRTERFYPIAQQTDIHNMHKGLIYAIVHEKRNEMRLVEKIRCQGYNGVDDAFTFSSKSLARKKPSPVIIEIPPDCIDFVRSLHIPPKKQKNETA